METMLSDCEVGWVDWFSSGTVLALGYVADLLSMVLGEIWLLQGRQNTETMLGTFEALGGWCATAPICGSQSVTAWAADYENRRNNRNN